MTLYPKLIEEALATVIYPGTKTNLFKFSSVKLSFPQAVPARTTWRRPLMPRQPYSVAVPSTE